MNDHSHSHYAVVNDLRIYYETHGPEEQGTPVVLLHGGVGGIEMFGPNLPALAEHHRLVAVDLQCHGRTGDVDRPLRYESMADDIAALVGRLGFARADVVGYSLGGGVAQQMAFRHPGLVRNLVIVSSPFRRTAFFPEILAIFDQMNATFAAGMKQSPLAKLYPDANWERLFTKIGDLQRQDFDWSAEVGKLRAPTLLIFADADTYWPEHIVEFYKLLGGGLHDAGLDGSRRSPNELAIVPGATHYSLLTTPTVAELAHRFLVAHG